MLESRFVFPFEAEGAYELSIPQCASWDSSKIRILCFLQTVDSRDLKAKGMLADKMVRMCATNAMNYALGIARKYDENLKSPAYVVAPFNRKRHLNLKGPARKGMENEFAAHAHKLIRKLKPTHVFVSGDEAFHAMWPQVEKHAYKRGWVHKLKSGEHKVLVTSSIDFSRLLEKQGELANLLGFWCRHLAYLMLGRHPHSLKGFEPTPRYINTIEKFDRLMDRLETEEIVAVDTETRDLSVLGNAIYTVQFALDSNPDCGYIVPVDHPLQDCWSKEDRKYIKNRLRKFFASQKKKTLVGFNIMYDLRVIRRCLKIPIIWHDVWEITAGEHDLDENISSLNTFGAKVGNLAAVLCSYECDFYYCVEGNQLVLLSDGARKKIKDVQVGDKIIAYDHATNLPVVSTVTRQQQTPVKKKLVRIKHEHGELMVTTDHQVWSVDRQDYVEAGSLLKGERLEVR